MTPIGIIALAGIGSVIGWLMWRMATLKTDPEGYSRIATYTDKSEVRQATQILDKAGIRYQLDDHSSHPQGTRVRVLVHADRLREAAGLLEHVVIKRDDDDNDEGPAA